MTDYPPRTSTDAPHDMPIDMQADLYDAGLIDDPDYFHGPNGLQPNAAKLRRWIKSGGDVWW